MPFVKYTALESPVWACQLTLDTQQEIIDEISSASNMGKLSDWTTKLNDVNNCREHTFRYANSTATEQLSLNDWLVRMPDGTLKVYNPEAFSLSFMNGECDYAIPEDRRRTFKEAMLDMVNTAFPELYLGNAQAVFKPYVNLVPAGAETNGKFSVAIDGASIVLTPNGDGRTGADMKNAEVTLKLAAPERITKYLISMDGDSYNAPKDWFVIARNSTDGTEEVLSEVAASAEKPGYYTPDKMVLADEFVFHFNEFELPNYQVKGIRLAVTKGGEYVEAPTPKPFTDFTPSVLEQVAEKLEIWYSVDANQYTVTLPNRGITDMTGLSEILPVLMKAPFIKPDTTIAINLTNNVITETRQPNQFDYPALQGLLYEIQCLPKAMQPKIVMLNFAATADDSPSAVAKSVTFNTAKLWIDFVDAVIQTTGCQSQSDIRK